MYQVNSIGIRFGGRYMSRKNKVFVVVVLSLRKSLLMMMSFSFLTLLRPFAITSGQSIKKRRPKSPPLLLLLDEREKKGSHRSSRGNCVFFPRRPFVRNGNERTENTAHYVPTEREDLVQLSTHPPTPSFASSRGIPLLALPFTLLVSLADWHLSHLLLLVLYFFFQIQIQIFPFLLWGPII